MDDAEQRLMKIFRDVFPHLPEEKIRAATQSTVQEWAPVAASQLMNEIEERFAIVVDYDLAAQLTSFVLILDYIERRLTR